MDCQSLSSVHRDRLACFINEYQGEPRLICVCMHAFEACVLRYTSDLMPTSVS